MTSNNRLVRAFILLLLLLSASAVALAQHETMTYYISAARIARVRSCPELTCDVVARFARGTPIEVIGTVQGDFVSGSAEWAHITLDGTDAYIHASLTSLTAPSHTSGVRAFHSDAQHLPASPHAPVNDHP